jgi:DNA-binding MarR family transcriptional regulator
MEGPPPTERMVGYLVKRVQQALRRNCDAALKPTGLSMAQYAVLRALADHPNASAAELARLCFVTRQSLQDVLAGLRGAGLVEPAALPPRGRAQSLLVTRSGRKCLGAADAVIGEVESTMTERIPRTAVTELADLLTVCAENLEAASGQ